MRLFEVLDPGSIRSILAVQQGQADSGQQYSQIPFINLRDELAELGISTIDGLIDLKNQVDPNGDVIKDINAETGMITLNTQAQAPGDTDKPKTATGPSVDTMAASGAKKLSPDI
jgi:hypothetical protein